MNGSSSGDSATMSCLSVYSESKHSNLFWFKNIAMFATAGKCSKQSYSATYYKNSKYSQ